MREAELLRSLLLEEIDIASEPEDEKILELIDRLILEEEITRKLGEQEDRSAAGTVLFCAQAGCSAGTAG